MALLAEMIDDAAGSGPMTVLARKLKVLAVRTGAEDMREWIGHELAGYDRDKPLPEYRGPFSVQPTGHFLGPFGFEMKHKLIDPRDFPPEARDSLLFNANVRDSIAELEALAHGESDPSQLWPPAAVSYLNTKLQKGTAASGSSVLVCASASYVVPRYLLKGILDQIRNTALDALLELEQVAPDAGEPSASPETNEAARGVLNVSFSFPNANFAGSNNSFGGNELQQTLHSKVETD